jgi:hypothetical protein
MQNALETEQKLKSIKKFQQEARKNKEHVLTAQCDVLEKCYKGIANNFFKKIKEVTRSLQPRLSAIKGEQGNISTIEHETKQVRKKIHIKCIQDRISPGEYTRKY